MNLNKKNIFIALLFFILKEGKSQYLGGINDGLALGTINNCTPLALPSLTNNALGGINDGFALGTINNCTPLALPSLTNNALGGVNDGAATGTATCLSILPIELVSFTAACNFSGYELQWVTASEKNCDYFLIERSLDTQNWIQLGRLNGAGNSNTLRTYSFSDPEGNSEIVYYRLKQVDFDTTANYSNIISQNSCDDKIDVLLFPNPSNNSFNLHVKALSSEYSIRVINMLGQIILESPFVNSITFGQQLVPGAYHLVILDSKGDLLNHNFKLVKIW